MAPLTRWEPLDPLIDPLSKFDLADYEHFFRGSDTRSLSRSFEKTMDMRMDARADDRAYGVPSKSPGSARKTSRSRSANQKPGTTAAC